MNCCYIYGLSTSTTRIQEQKRECTDLFLCQAFSKPHGPPTGTAESEYLWIRFKYWSNSYFRGNEYKILIPGKEFAYIYNIYNI